MAFESGKLHILYKHGMSKTRVYKIWAGMRKRILNPKAHAYHRYGGRGLKISESWDEFINFFTDMGNPPTNKHSIERIDNDKGYSKENCKWATPQEQHKNKSNSVYIESNGERLHLSDWAEKVGLSREGFTNRLKRWGKEKALSINRIKYSERLIEFNGVTKSVMGWSKFLGINYSTISGRLRKGLSINEVFSLEKLKIKEPLGVKLLYKGKLLTIRDWAKYLELNLATLKGRLDRGWTVERALSTSRLSPNESRVKIIEYDGQKYTIRELADKLNINYSTLKSRIQKGLPLERALKPNDKPIQQTSQE